MDVRAWDVADRNFPDASINPEWVASQVEEVFTQWGRSVLFP